MHRSATKAILGPTNTGKTHYAIERLCGHSSGIIGFPLRLLAREAYDRVVAIKGPGEVALITGEERIVPQGARWLLCTMESMPRDRDVAFVAIDEAQLGADPERGHVFTDRLLNVRGREETLILGSDTIRSVVRDLVPDVETLSRPRFSKLSYAGPKKLSRLPPRTAIIAFSADEVYAIAEIIRRTRGGAAIVMGSLSPRTRNAQVAMYQAGEVDFLVATDAIGMGLNMDVGHVAFASLTKFDGQRQRRLRPNELAQIAGRAGRYQRDGSFGIALTAQNSAEFSQEEIDRIEEHRFAPVDWLYWRNADLDFGGPVGLLASLGQMPLESRLRLTPEADDQIVLRRLAGDLLARGERFDTARTQRLWDACGLPDFRASGPEFHAQTVARIFQHIGNGTGTIPIQTIAGEIARLDSVQGDVPTLTGRLSAIRIWSYVANRPDWLENPSEWVERSRAVEQTLSDALHARLTERFVERRAARILRSATTGLAPGDVAFADDGTVLVLDEPVGRVDGFHFTADRAAQSPETRRMIAVAEARLPVHFARKAAELAASLPHAFHIRTNEGEAPALIWCGTALARLVRGRGLLAPGLTLEPALARLEHSARDMIQRHCRDVMTNLIEQRLRPLHMLSKAAFDPQTPTSLRAFLAPLAESGGALPRAELAEMLAALSPEQRKAARALGIVIGSLTIFHPPLLKPEAVRLRIALIAARGGLAMPPLPMAGLGLLDRPLDPLAAGAATAGFYRLGDQMLRYDLLERVARSIHDQRGAAPNFAPDAQLATSLGMGAATFDRVLRALGFVPASDKPDAMWRWRGLRQSPVLKSRTRDRTPNSVIPNWRSRK